MHHIESNLYKRQGKSITNFSHTLPDEQSDLAKELFKSSYNLEFLTLEKRAKEKDLEKNLISNIRDFLLELGTGFAFMGSQYKITVEEEDFYIDLLFYHVRLQAYVVIELKTGKFIPEYAGKMGFYLAAIDHQIKRPEDHPSIGLILCQMNKHLIVEYALKGSTKPIGVSGYKITESLPKELKDALPSAIEIQNYLEQHIDEQSNKQLPKLKLMTSD